MDDVRSAKLVQSENGYAFYLLEGFEFTAEEPSKDLVFSKNSPDNSVRIEVFDAQTNIEDVKKNASDELALIGEAA